MKPATHIFRDRLFADSTDISHLEIMPIKLVAIVTTITRQERFSLYDENDFHVRDRLGAQYKAFIR